MHLSTGVLSVGVDTLTCSHAWEGGVDSFISLTQYLLRDDTSHGSKVVYFKRGSYRGVQTRGVGLAFAPGRVLAEIRGALAHEFWPHYLDRAEKVSRIDLEVTARVQPYDPGMAVDLALAEREKATTRGRPSQWRLELTPGGGSTLYIGKGASRYQARMYEAAYKHPKQGLEESWRYELQARRERAQQMADLLLSDSDPRPFVQAAVHQHFTRKGVAPIFDPSAAADVAPLPPADSDRDKSLRWLHSSIAPALARHRAWGSYVEALKALGIEGEAA